MRLVVDLSTGSVSLDDPAETEHFLVLVLPAEPGDRNDAAALGAVAAALSVHDAGTVDPEGNAFIPVDVVRRLAAAGAEDRRTLGADWQSRFAAMLAQASEHGWVTDEGSIQAHIEWGRR